MKKLISLVLALALALAPAAAFAVQTESVELSHEWDLFDFGVTHTAAIQPVGQGYAWGYNYDGPIGNGIMASSNTTTPYNWGSDVSAVSVNRKTTLSIDTNGVLYVCGEFWFGIGGDPSMPSGGYATGHPMQFDTNVRQASMGSNHLVYVKNDDTLWVYGENGNGQIGDNTTTSCYTAKQILTNVAYAVAGNCLTAAVKNDGTLWVWGRNSDGQVGNGSTTDRKTPVQVLTNVYTVSTMGDFVFALKNDGSLWAWGDNQYGQLGLGNTTDKKSPTQVMTGVAQVSAGVYHTGIIKTDGTLWFCGNNWRGEFGSGSTGSYSGGVSTFTQTPGSFVAVKCGSNVSGAVKESGQLFVAGENTKGQLGTGTECGSIPTLTPIDVWIFGAGDVYTVTFVDYDGTVLKTQQVMEGSAATAPANPTRLGYTFTGWDRDFSSVTSDMTVTAQYSINSYRLTILYVYENGTTAAATYTGDYDYGASYSVTSPTISGCTPDKATVRGTMGAANTTVTVTYKSNSVTPTVLIGDADCNGVVDMRDVTALNAYLVNSGTLTTQGILNADVNGDGSLTAYDSTLIAMIALGISLPN